MDCRVASSSQDESGHTALHIVAINGNLQIAAILLKANARPDVIDPLGNTPLLYAADRNQVEMAQLDFHYQLLAAQIHQC